MQLQAYVADQTEKIAESLCHFLETTASDRRDWRVSTEGGETRSALQQISECVTVNRYFAQLLRGGEFPAGALPEIAFESAEDTKSQLRESAAELAQTIRTLSDADLDRVFHHPRAEILGSNLIIMPFRNMTYHAGQINFIQTLSGDMEFHTPSNWR